MPGLDLGLLDAQGNEEEQSAWLGRLGVLQLRACATCCARLQRDGQGVCVAHVSALHGYNSRARAWLLCRRCMGAIARVLRVHSSQRELVVPAWYAHG